MVVALGRLCKKKNKSTASRLCKRDKVCVFRSFRYRSLPPPKTTVHVKRMKKDVKDKLESVTKATSSSLVSVRRFFFAVDVVAYNLFRFLFRLSART